MNINLSRNYEINDEGEPLSVTDTMDAHLALLTQTTAYAFTGRQALLPETDLPDAYRVWNETADGNWVWVNPDGEIIVRARPMLFRPDVEGGSHG